MTQIYARKTIFLESELALMVADRNITYGQDFVGMIPFSIIKPCEPRNKIQTIGSKAAYSFGGPEVPKKTKTGVNDAYVNLSERLADDTWDDALRVVQEHFRGLAKQIQDTFNLSGTYDLVMVGYDRCARIVSFKATPRGIRNMKSQGVVSANTPAKGAIKFIRYLEDIFASPYKGFVPLNVNGYSPLDFAVFALRSAIGQDSMEDRYTISRNVDIVVIGPEGIHMFDDYQNFPQSSNGGSITNKSSGLIKAAADFMEQSQKKVIGREAPEANLNYRIVLSGLNDILRYALRYPVAMREFFAKGRDQIPIKREISLFATPPELLSKPDLEQRFRLLRHFWTLSQNLH